MNDAVRAAVAVEGWLAIVNQLATVGAVPLTISQGPRGVARFDPDNLALRVVERLTPRTATVDWCEAGICHYSEQTWVAATAKHSGACALTGARIRHGDHIYRPRSATPPPGNAGAMIVADEILMLPRAWESW